MNTNEILLSEVIESLKSLSKTAKGLNEPLLSAILENNIDKLNRIKLV